jgi:hypothetical protein
MKVRPVLALLLSLTLTLSACVSIPIPPTDMGAAKAGELGTLNVRVVAEYKPNWAGTTQAALRQWSGDGKTTKKPTR